MARRGIDVSVLIAVSPSSKRLIFSTLGYLGQRMFNDVNWRVRKEAVDRLQGIPRDRDALKAERAAQSILLFSTPRCGVSLSTVQKVRWESPQPCVPLSQENNEGAGFRYMLPLVLYIVIQGHWTTKRKNNVYYLRVSIMEASQIFKFALFDALEMSTWAS